MKTRISMNQNEIVFSSLENMQNISCSYTNEEHENDYYTEDITQFHSYEDVLKTEKTCGPSATWRKYWIMYMFVGSLGIKDKRRLFFHMRKDDVDEHSFFPKYGFTAGEFAVYQKLTEKIQKDKKRKRDDIFETCIDENSINSIDEDMEMTF